VDVNTVNLFKVRLDRFWANQDVKYDFMADLPELVIDQRMKYVKQFYIWLCYIDTDRGVSPASVDAR